ncbi:MAG: hypothetical protein M0Q53_20320 [Prolixibacteraceae bacterium]|jgi:hypothetical protein|nr:hypothetical protein [Prolixibacteraceae bacterium]
MEKKSDKTMQTNHHFSFHRLLLLGKQSFLIHKKLIGISLAGFAGVLFLLLLWFQNNFHYIRWENKHYMILFAFLFFIMGIIYTGLSFPAFRSKEKSMAYLMLPATSTEKFVFELLSRIVVFIFLMPVLFWLVANFEGIVVHSFIPEWTNYKFSFVDAYAEINEQGKFEGWACVLLLQGILFLFITAFTGACHFSKSPLLKTMFTVSIIAAGYALFSFLLAKGLNLQEYHPANDRISKNSVIATFAVLSTMVNLCLLTIAWFGLKEKEV